MTRKKLKKKLRKAYDSKDKISNRLNILIKEDLKRNLTSSEETEFILLKEIRDERK